MTNREARYLTHGVILGFALAFVLVVLAERAKLQLAQAPQTCISALDGPFGKQVACPYAERK